MRQDSPFLPEVRENEMMASRIQAAASPLATVRLPMRLRWWMPLGLGMFLGSVTGLIVPSGWLISRYWWMVSIPLALSIGLLSVLAWSEKKRGALNSKFDQAAVQGHFADGRKEGERPPGAAKVLHFIRDGGLAKRPARSPEGDRDSPGPEDKGGTVFPNFKGGEAPARSHRGGRRVRLTKVAGKHPGGPVHPVVGFEGSAPTVGKRYRVFTDGGTMLITSVVVEQGPDYIRTLNSYYDLRILGEE